MRDVGVDEHIRKANGVFGAVPGLRHVIIIEQQAEGGNVDGIDERRGLGGGVDDVTFVGTKRFERDNKTVFGGAGGYYAAEAHKLVKRAGVVKAVRDVSRPAAAKDGCLAAEPCEP